MTRTPAHGHAPAPRRNAEEQAQVDAALAALFERYIPFNQLLGVKLVNNGATSVPSLQFDMRPDLVGQFQSGRLHGGVIASVLDAVGGLALVWTIAEKHADEPLSQMVQRFSKFGTIDLRVDYLRPGLGKHFVAHAEVMRLGSRVGSTQMRLLNDEGTLISTAAAAYIVS